MSIGFLFSGQGSQCTGMGKNFYEQYKEFRDIYDNADVGFDIAKMCFDESEAARLNETQYTQPCLVAYQIGVAEILKKLNIQPEYVAGVSLGEYSALYTAGVWDTQTTLKLVRQRGILMEDSVKQIDDCKTVSIIGLSYKEIEEICLECSDYGVVEVSIYCCDGNVSVAGQTIAVDKVMEMAKKRGAKHCIPLKSPYPFHTSLLHDVGEELEKLLGTVEMRAMQIPVIFNYTGDLKGDQNISYLLKMQVQSSIYLEKTIRYMEKAGVDTIIEISPDNVNAKIINRISKKIRTYSINDVGDVQELCRVFS